jgi:cytoskeletal protein CcmA (bactofilin family)
VSESVETYKRVVVNGLWEGSVLPGRVEEMLREVVLQPGSRVTGSVFGNVVRIEGPAEVVKAVYASRDIEIVPAGEIRLRSSVGAKELLTSCAGPGRLIIEGDVIARSIHLNRCIVRGSVHAAEVRLRDAVVLGAVHGSSLVDLENSTALTAYGDEVLFREGCGLILPYARANHRMRVEHPVRLVALEAQEAALTWEDTVAYGGVLHLTAGRRLTDLARVRAFLENVSTFLLQITAGDAIRTASGQLQFEADRLPPVFASLLAEGAL